MIMERIVSESPEYVNIIKKMTIEEYSGTTQQRKEPGRR